MKKNAIIAISVIFISLLGIISIKFLSGEDSWICENGQWVRHGNPRDSKPSNSCMEERILTQPEAAEKNIELFSPAAGDEIALPAVIKGKARVFENTVNVDLKEKDGTILYEGITMADSPDIGQFGNFEKEISYLIKFPKSEDLIAEVYCRSPKDGEKIDLISMPLKLKLIEAATLKLYFHNDNLDPAVSCNKVFPVERIIPKTQIPAKRAIELLLEGPVWNESDGGYATNINQGVKLNSLNIKDGSATVDFDEMLEKNLGGSCQVSAIRAEITETLKQFPAIKSVIITVNGRSEEVLQP